MWLCFFDLGFCILVMWGIVERGLCDERRKEGRKEGK